MSTKEYLELRQLRAELELKEDRLADVERENQQLRELLSQRQDVPVLAPVFFEGDEE
jgi:cell shape-determining protein MreC